jgi:hypothetical protein
VHGIETTRTATPDFSSSRAAPTASCTSEPVAMSVMAGSLLPLETMYAPRAIIAICSGVRGTCGRSWRVSTRHRRAVRSLDRGAPRDGRLDSVARPPEIHVRHEPQAREMLDRLVRRTVLAKTDRVVRQHVDAAQADESRHTQRVARVVGEDEETCRRTE